MIPLRMTLTGFYNAAWFRKYNSDVTSGLWKHSHAININIASLDMWRTMIAQCDGDDNDVTGCRSCSPDAALRDYVDTQKIKIDSLQEQVTRMREYIRSMRECITDTSLFTHKRYTFRRFYRAMHFSAKRGIAMSSVCLSVTLVDCDHIGWNTYEIISPLVSLGCSLSADPNIIGLL